MSDIPYLPLYVNDYEGDTAHLSISEDGAYSRLIRLCWRTSGCSIPSDPKWLMKHMRASQEEYDMLIKPIITDYFTVKKGRVFQKRLQKEFEQISAKIKAQKINGKKGGDAKALKDKKKKPSQGKVSPVAKSYHPEPYLEPELEVDNTKKTKAKKIFDGIVPQEWIDWALQNGLSLTSVEIEKDNFIDFFTGVKAGDKRADWFKSWCPWIRKHREYGLTQTVDPLQDIFNKLDMEEAAQ